MKTLTRYARRCGGSALATVMVLILVMSVILAATAKMGSQRAFTAKRLAEVARAQAIAEAGAHKAYSILSTNFAQRTNAAAFPLTQFANGTYDVTIRSITNTEYQVLIISTGTYGSAVVDVVLDSVKDYRPPETNTTPQSIVGYGMLAGGSIDLGGGLDATGAMVHANGMMEASGNVGVNSKVTSCVKIYGNGNVDIPYAKAPIVDLPKKNPGVVVLGPVPVVTIPQIDLTPYYLEAQKNGQVYTNFPSFSGSVPGGIIWIVGDAHISGNNSITSCIIATGTIRLAGNGEITKYGQYPVLVSRDANIDISGHANINGTIYTRTGWIEKTGGGVLKGAVISKGDIRGRGGWTGIFNLAATPTPPNVSTNNDTAVVYVAAWQK